MSCTGWTNDGRGGAYRVVGDLIALRVQPIPKTSRHRYRVERAPADAANALRHAAKAQVIVPWMEAEARHQVGAIMEAEARGRQVLEMELAVLLEGGL